MGLKKITAIIRSGRLKDVEERLKGPDIPGITVDHVKGWGEYADYFASDWMSSYARIEIVADDRRTAWIIDAISEVVHTGIPGDGIVYVVPVEQLHRIRDRHIARSERTHCPTCLASRRLRRSRRRQTASADAGDAG